MYTQTLSFDSSRYMSNSLIDQSVIEEGTKNTSVSGQSAKLWNMRARTLVSNLKGTEGVNQVKEKIVEILQNYLLNTNLSDEGMNFTKSFIMDVKTQPLTTVKEKYFTTNRESILNFNSPIVSDMFKIFSGTSDFSIQDLYIKEETNLRGIIKQQGEAIPQNRNELLKFMIYLKDAHRKEIGGQLDSYVVDINELDEFIKNAVATNQEQKRVQLIVRSDVHYTAIDLELSPGKNQAFVLDAALDMDRLNVILDKLKNMNHFNKIYSASDMSIQKDKWNCGTFSLSNISATSKKENLFDMLAALPSKEASGVIEIPWNELDGSLVKLAQTTTLIKNHKDADTALKQDVTLKQYMAMHLGKKEITNGETTRVVDANFAVDHKLEKYTDLALYCFDNLPLKGAAKIAFTYPVLQYNQHQGKVNL